MNSLVHKGVLDLFDEYHGDFGLLYERGVPEADRQKFSSEQLNTLSQYVSQLEFSRVDVLSAALRAKVHADIDRLEALIDEEVVTILRKRILPTSRLPGSNS